MAMTRIEKCLFISSLTGFLARLVGLGFVVWFYIEPRRSTDLLGPKDDLQFAMYEMCLVMLVIITAIDLPIVCQCCTGPCVGR